MNDVSKGLAFSSAVISVEKNLGVLSMSEDNMVVVAMFIDRWVVMYCM